MKASLYRHYMLGVLLLILALNSVDRLALGLVLQDIKLDLHLSDTQLGVLTGIAFALFYSIMGVPIAWWADRGNRITIISISTALWTVAMVLCGLAGSFAQLLLIRVGLAIGEAGCVPPAHSLIPDYFSRAERPRAVAVFMLGGSLSAVVGYFGAGWLAQFYGWRATFVLIGLPGLALAALAWRTLKEPRRATRPEEPPASQPSLGDVARTLGSNRTFRHLVLGFSMIAFFGNGVIQWQPAYFIRTFGFTTGELGTWFALLYGVGTFAGVYGGGALASRYAANNERLQLAAIATLYCGFALAQASIYLTSNRYVALAMAAIAACGAAAINGPLFATVQTLVPARMRAMSIALIYFFSNLIGLGLGPLAAGALSDGLRPIFAADSLRFALLALCPGYLWAAWHLWRASRSVMADLASAKAADAASTLSATSSY